MRMVKEMFEMWVKASTSPLSNDWMGWAMLVLIWCCNLMVGYLFYILLIRPILYKKKYSELKIDTGIVEDKKYETHTQTTYVQSGKTSVPVITTTTYHYVYLKGEVIDQRVDSSNWYDEFNAGDSVKMEYKEVYETLRFATEDNWEFVGNDVLTLEKI